MLFHALLLGTQRSVIDASKVGPAASNSQPLNVVLAVKPAPRREDARQKAASKQPNNLTIRKQLEEPKIMPVNKPAESAPKPTPDLSRDTSTETGKASAQAIGMALQSMVTQQYMMMRLQQFFSMSRASAKGIIKSRFTPDEMAHHRGKRCTLRLLVAPVPGQGYEVANPECDDPDLAAELQTMPWSTAMPLPSEYSLPYRGLVIHLNIGSYDVSIGLEPMVN